MKNIEAIMTEAGIELTDEQKQKVNDGIKENYKTVEDYKKQKEKIEVLEGTVKEAQEALKKFEGVDADDLKKQIKELNETIDKNKKAFEEQLAERDFTDTIDKAIAAAKGKNAKAIKALLDIDKLKESKNQADDLAKAIKALTEADDSKMLFGEPEPQKKGTGNPIGTVKKDAAAEPETLNSALAAHYNNK